MPQLARHEVLLALRAERSRLSACPTTHVVRTYQRSLRTRRAHPAQSAPAFHQAGQLSVEFSHNRRASFVSPIRFYLFASILFFFLLAQFADLTSDIRPNEVEPEDVVAVSDEAVQRFLDLIDPSMRAKAQEVFAREGSIAQQVIRGAASGAFEELEPDGTPNWFETFFYGQMITILHDPPGFLDNALENIPFAMFFLLPLYALLLKLIFFGSRKYFVEHVVFALHLHTFIFLMVAVVMVLPDEGFEWIELGILGWYLGYVFLALRRFYEQSKIRTGIKMVLLFVLYQFALLPTMFLTMLATASLI